MGNIPSYITRSSNGIFYFQKRVNSCIQSQLGISQPLYRKSLRTKDKKEAIIRASNLHIKIDTLQTMEFKTFRQDLDDLLLEQHNFDGYAKLLHDKRKKYYQIAEAYLDSPEPSYKESPLGIESKDELFLESYDHYELSIIHYFVQEVKSDRKTQTEAKLRKLQEAVELLQSQGIQNVSVTKLLDGSIESQRLLEITRVTHPEQTDEKQPISTPSSKTTSAELTQGANSIITPFSAIPRIHEPQPLVSSPWVAEVRQYTYLASHKYN